MGRRCELVGSVVLTGGGCGKWVVSLDNVNRLYCLPLDIDGHWIVGEVGLAYFVDRVKARPEIDGPFEFVNSLLDLVY